MFSNAREIGHPCGRAIRLLLWHGVFFPNIHRRSTADHCPPPPKLTVEVSSSSSWASDHDSGPVMVTTSGSMVRLFFAESNNLPLSLRRRSWPSSSDTRASPSRRHCPSQTQISRRRLPRIY